ncbi:SRPBCC family protein [Arthrobacter sp. L77]|uniref:SRPBCC family protein n=1 Tax=Arthrobacter sp. L77 TaxID=1496689 RepID=UPI0005B7F5E4|nr:SRPBCC family protein [Arthrobacter sp. L77]
MQWTETITIEAPRDIVYQAVRDQHTLMRWSAWPEATGFTCRVDGDGMSPGSQIVFTDQKGVEQGRQTLVSADPGIVRNTMRNRGPRGRWVSPNVDFHVDPVTPTQTRVSLAFDVDPPVPRIMKPLANRWLRRSIRPLHVKDLQQLKDLVEATHVR